MTTKPDGVDAVEQLMRQLAIGRAGGAALIDAITAAGGGSRGDVAMSLAGVIIAAAADGGVSIDGYMAVLRRDVDFLLELAVGSAAAEVIKGAPP